MQTLRVDHVGSLLRPEPLKQAFRDHALGSLSAEALRAAQDKAIRDVIARQEALGLPVATDGEYRRLNWQVSFSEVAGWDLWSGSWKKLLQNPGDKAAHETPLQKGDDAVLAFRVPATSRLELVKSFPLGEFAFLKQTATSPTKITPKVTLMSPDRVAQMCDIDGSRPHYAGADEFLADVVAIQRRMVGELVEAGCEIGRASCRERV